MKRYIAITVMCVLVAAGAAGWVTYGVTNYLLDEKVAAAHDKYVQAEQLIMETNKERDKLESEREKFKKNKTELRQNSYIKGCQSTIDALTPCEVTISSDGGAMLTYRDGTGYYLEPGQVENNAIKVKSVTAKSDHKNCIDVEDIVYMNLDEYGYYQLELGDNNWDKYRRIAKQVDYTEKEMKQDIKKAKAEK